MSGVHASFTYETGEYARALRRVQARRHRARLDSCVAAALFGVGVCLWASSGFGFWPALACGLAALFLGVLAFVVLVVPVLAERAHPKLREPYSLDFSEEGIHFETPTVDSRVSWSLYHSWLEDADFIYLFHGQRDLTVLPVRAFASPEGLSEIRRLLSGKLGASADA